MRKDKTAEKYIEKFKDELGQASILSINETYYSLWTLILKSESSISEIKRHKKLPFYLQKYKMLQDENSGCKIILIT